MKDTLWIFCYRRLLEVPLNRNYSKVEVRKSRECALREIDAFRSTAGAEVANGDIDVLAIVWNGKLLLEI